MLGGAFHEERDVRVVEQVVAEMLGSETIISNVRTFVDMRIHTQRCGVDYHLVALHHLGSKIGITYNPLARRARHELGLYAEVLKAAADGLGGTSGAEYESGLMIRAQKRTD